MDDHWRASAEVLGTFLRERGFDILSRTKELTEAAREHPQFADMGERELGSVVSIVQVRWHREATAFRRAGL